MRSLSQTNGLYQTQLSLQRRVPSCLMPCVKEDHCRLSAAPDTGPELSHFTHWHPGFLTADFHFLPSSSSQFLYYNTPFACLPVFSPGQVSWSFILLVSLGPWPTDSTKRPGTSPTQQLCGPHAYKNQPIHPPTSCTEFIHLFVVTHTRMHLQAAQQD